MLDPSLTTWRAQYDRLVRSRDRVLAPYKSSVEYGDDLQHYFQDCWHLKEWIKNDKLIGVGKAIEREVKAHKALEVIADLANAAKHLNHAERKRHDAYVTSTNVTVHLGQDKPIDVVYVITLGDGATLSAQDLVRDGFLAWEGILTKVGLLP